MCVGLWFCWILIGLFVVNVFSIKDGLEVLVFNKVKTSPMSQVPEAY